MAFRDVSVPAVLRVSSGAMRGLAAQLAEHDFDLSRVVLVGGGPRTRRLVDAVAEDFCRQRCPVETYVDVGAGISDVAGLAAVVIERECSLIVSVGGGRVIDVGKLAAARTGVPFVSVPTTVAHDGVSSPVASLWDAGGARRSYAACMPAAVVLDIDVLTASPMRTRAAGLGDLLSNLAAVLDWERAQAHGQEVFDDFSALIARTAAQRAMSLQELQTPAALTLLGEGLILSGLAMSAAGTSRPCSGAEHLVSHSLDDLLGQDARLHGEQVALGTLLAFHLLGADATELRTVFARCGVPSHPEELGLPVETLADAVLAAPATRPERHTVLSEQITSRADARDLCREVFG